MFLLLKVNSPSLFSSSVRSFDIFLMTDDLFLCVSPIVLVFSLSCMIDDLFPGVSPIVLVFLHSSMIDDLFPGVSPIVLVFLHSCSHHFSCLFLVASFYIPGSFVYVGLL